MTFTYKITEAQVLCSSKPEADKIRTGIPVHNRHVLKKNTDAFMFERAQYSSPYSFSKELF